jgi:GNAT superfamily N-acetyltransferase
MNESTPESIGITYRKATLGEILPLRDEVLIRGTDRDSPAFPEDQDPSTHHMGAFRNGTNIACLSLMYAPYEDRNAFQLRGMAVNPEYQGTGVGKSLLNFAERWVVRNTSTRVLWCNARIAAVRFYEKQGWEVVSEQFLIAGVGLHHRMVRKMTPT